MDDNWNDDAEKQFCESVDALRKKFQTVINAEKLHTFAAVEDALLMTLMDVVFTAIKAVSEKQPYDMTQRVAIVGLKHRFETYLQATKESYEKKFNCESKPNLPVVAQPVDSESELNSPEVLKVFEDLMTKLGVDPNVKH